MTFHIPHTIRIRLPHAQEVALIGDFNHWHSNAHPLVQVAPGLWERIVDLPSGKHRYAFFVVDDVKETDGAIRSRIVGNGSVLWVPENPDHSFSVTAHPSQALRHIHASRGAALHETALV